MLRRKRERSTAAGTRNWLELPWDVTALILSRLDPSTWRSIDMRNSGERDKDHVHDKMCVHAVGRSCGHLLDINIEYFGTDELLFYISERSNHLKRLRLFSCYEISDEGLSTAASKLPFLEELEISICPISKHAVETIGRSCPLLRSFKFNLQRCKGYVCDDEAVAIAQTMPELRRLQLLGNGLKNEGLQAILHGCPHLEYLDLRQCFSVRLVGNLERRCVERMKNLRHPCDPPHDYEFSAEDLDFWFYPSD
ncbi:Translation initiation factor 3B1 isoform 1 [Hibiscus syriacus]|uniref:Translation initiation factor 3B1 isoform 1 n=1 Tax=Hibiscus syriacus TaxID=106335 RepID=A0A6A2YB71_HIBSY|nr:Translation initiation factor 3B1 isoform 1 [Hibiscus syriacus]